MPFAVTVDDRIASGDSRLLLQERYGTRDGYVTAVRAAAHDAACKGYLNAGATAASMGAQCTNALPAGAADDWAVPVNQAINSDVLK